LWNVAPNLSVIGERRFETACWCRPKKSMDVSTLYYDIITNHPVELRHICEERKADGIDERFGYCHTVCNFRCRNGL